MRLINLKNDITLFSINAIPRYCAPSGPILLHVRISVVSVWIDINDQFTLDNENEPILRDFSVMH